MTCIVRHLVLPVWDRLILYYIHKIACVCVWHELQCWTIKTCKDIYHKEKVNLLLLNNSGFFTRHHWIFTLFMPFCCSHHWCIRVLVSISLMWNSILCIHEGLNCWIRSGPTPGPARHTWLVFTPTAVCCSRATNHNTRHLQWKNPLGITRQPTDCLPNITHQPR